MSNCLYCDRKIQRYRLISVLLLEDCLCSDCREKMRYDPGKFIIEGLEVRYFYHYDSLFSDILLQYKEGMDEALYQVFSYKICQQISRTYRGYEIILVPSVKTKIQARGFDHLRLIIESCSLKITDGIIMKDEICQKGKNRQQRNAMRSNYLYTGKQLKNVLIIDDVYTTGSSVLGVYQALLGHAERIKAVVLAKV